MSNKFDYKDSLIGGTATLIFALTFSKNYYDKYIKNLTPETPVANANDRAFTILLHFLGEWVGKIGIQIVLGIVALLFFYLAYRLYKNR